MTPSQRLIENTLYFCKKQHTMIQNFEAEIGMRRSSLARYGRSERPLKLDTACKIASYFGKTVDEMCSTDFEKQDRIAKLEKDLARLKGSESVEKPEPDTDILSVIDFSAIEPRAFIYGGRL